jgi:hypothetical protein
MIPRLVQPAGATALAFRMYGDMEGVNNLLLLRYLITEYSDQP